MPFDSHEYVVHFRLIQPVEKGGGGLLFALARFNQGWGGGVAVCFGAVQPGVGGGGGGGLLSALVRFNQGRGFCPLLAHSISGGGGGGGAVPFQPIQSVGGGGGRAYMLTFIIRMPFSPKGGGGGGGHGPLPPLWGRP